MTAPLRSHRHLLNVSVLWLFFVACGKDPSAPPPEPNPTFYGGMLVNGDAESGDGTPSAWRPEASTPHTYLLDWAQMGSSGGRSLSISASANPNETAFAGWSQSVTEGIPVGRDLTLRAKVRVQDVHWTGAILALRADTENPPTDAAEYFVTTQGFDLITDTADWASYEVTLPRVHDDVRAVTVYLILRARNGTAWFDEVGLYASVPW